MVEAHKHDGIDGVPVAFDDLEFDPGTALTEVDDTVLSTGGASDLKTTDSDVIDNLRTRVNELEAILQKFGFLP